MPYLRFRGSPATFHQYFCRSFRNWLNMFPCFLIVFKISKCRIILALSTAKALAYFLCCQFSQQQSLEWLARSWSFVIARKYTIVTLTQPLMILFAFFIDTVYAPIKRLVAFFLFQIWINGDLGGRTVAADAGRRRSGCGGRTRGSIGEKVFRRIYHQELTKLWNSRIYHRVYNWQSISTNVIWHLWSRRLSDLYFDTHVHVIIFMHK